MNGRHDGYGEGHGSYLVPPLSFALSLDAICRGAFDCYSCDCQTGRAVIKKKKAPNKQTLQLCPTYSLVLPRVSSPTTPVLPRLYFLLLGTPETHLNRLSLTGGFPSQSGRASTFAELTQDPLQALLGARAPGTECLSNLSLL